MHLDDYISKYLDGELAAEEDIQLRKMLAEDASSKEVFDASVIIHTACLEDAASISAPSDLLSRTEDKVLMKILSQQPIYVDTVYRRRRAPVLSSLIIILLFLSIFRISDMYLENIGGKDRISEILNQEKERIGMQVGDEQSTEIIIKKAAGGSGTIQKNSLSNSGADTPNKTNELTAGTDPKNNLLPQSESNTAKPVQTEEIKAQPVNTELAASNSSSKEQKNMPASPQPVAYNQSLAMLPQSINNMNSSNLPGFKILPGKIDLSGFSSEIQLTSFLGTSLLKEQSTLVKSSVVSQFSQSVGYAFSKSQKLGIEFGYTTFAYDDHVKVVVPLDDPVSGKVSKEPEILVLNPNENGGSFLEFPATISHEKQLIWGTVYFEQEVANIYNISLNGRLGLGGSSDGPLGFGKIFARYKVFSFIHLTAGIEGRLYQAKIYNSSVYTSDLRKSLNLIYGLEIKF